MALTAAELAQKELDKAVAELEKKRSIRSKAVDNVKAASKTLDQAKEAALVANAALEEQVALCDWWAKHPLLQVEESATAEVPGQTTIEDAIAPEIAAAAAAQPTPEDIVAEQQAQPEGQSWYEKPVDVVETAAGAVAATATQVTETVVPAVETPPAAAGGLEDLFAS